MAAGGDPPRPRRTGLHASPVPRADRATKTCSTWSSTTIMKACSELAQGRQPRCRRPGTACAVERRQGACGLLARRHAGRCGRRASPRAIGRRPRPCWRRRPVGSTPRATEDRCHEADDALERICMLDWTAYVWMAGRRRGLSVLPMPRPARRGGRWWSRAERRSSRSTCTRTTPRTRWSLPPATWTSWTELTADEAAELTTTTRTRIRVTQARSAARRVQRGAQPRGVGRGPSPSTCTSTSYPAGRGRQLHHRRRRTKTLPQLLVDTRALLADAWTDSSAHQVGVFRRSPLEPRIAGFDDARPGSRSPG